MIKLRKGQSNCWKRFQGTDIVSNAHQRNSLQTSLDVLLTEHSKLIFPVNMRQTRPFMVMHRSPNA